MEFAECTIFKNLCTFRVLQENLDKERIQAGCIGSAGFSFRMIARMKLSIRA